MKNTFEKKIYGDRWVVELCDGCWVSGGSNRTMVARHAKIYETISAATHALAYNRTSRDWLKAEIYRVDLRFERIRSAS